MDKKFDEASIMRLVEWLEENGRFKEAAVIRKSLEDAKKASNVSRTSIRR